MLNYFLFNNPILTADGDHSDPSWFFGTSVKWYGVFMSLAILTAVICICIKLWKWYKIPVDPVYYFALIGIPIAICGARLWSMIIGDAKGFFNFRDGGLAIEGGVMATVVAGLIYFPLVLRLPKFYKVVSHKFEKVEVKKISSWVYADAIVPAILIGQVIGRWGNYFNQELYGSVVNENSFIVHFMKAFHLGLMQGNGQVDGSSMEDGNWYQPLFLYESSLNFVGFITIFVSLEFLPGKYKKAGDLAIIYFIWYGIVRVIMEPLRDTTFSFPLTYWMTGLWIAGGIVLFLLNRFFWSRKRQYKLFKLIPSFICSRTKLVCYNIRMSTVQFYFYICMLTANCFTLFKKINKIDVWYSAHTEKNQSWYTSKTGNILPKYEQDKKFIFTRNENEQIWYNER